METDKDGYDYVFTIDNPDCSEFTDAYSEYDPTRVRASAEGSLCPDRVDPFSGYRYYSPEQIKVLERIVKWKALGFELGEIR